MRAGSGRLRRLVRQALVEAAGGDPKRTALDAFMQALEQAYTVEAGKAGQAKVQGSLDNLRSRIEPMLADISRYLRGGR